MHIENLNKIVFLGDSLIEGYGVLKEEGFVEILKNKGFNLINEGISGDTTFGMLSRLQEIIYKYNPNYIFLMGGTNDFLWNTDISILKSVISSIIAICRKKSISVIIGIPPFIDVKMAQNNWGSSYGFDFINVKLKDYRNWIIEFSDELDYKYMNFQDYFLLENDKVDSKFFIDGIHLNMQGNKILATLFEEQFYNLK